MDAAVLPVVRGQCRPSPASRARLQSRQLPAHAGDARADQGLVADQPEGEADQDRREGRQPRPLCRLPDGRGRRAEDAVRRDPAADRRTAATVAAAPGMSIASNDRWQPDGRGVSMNDRELPNAAARWGASLMTRVYAASEAGSSPRRLAATGATAHDRPSEAGIRKIPAKAALALPLRRDRPYLTDMNRHLTSPGRRWRPPAARRTADASDPPPSTCRRGAGTFPANNPDAVTATTFAPALHRPTTSMDWVAKPSCTPTVSLPEQKAFVRPRRRRQHHAVEQDLDRAPLQQRAVMRAFGAVGDHHRPSGGAVEREGRPGERAIYVDRERTAGGEQRG